MRATLPSHTGGEGTVYCRDFQRDANVTVVQGGKSDVFSIEPLPRSVCAQKGVVVA